MSTLHFQTEYLDCFAGIWRTLFQGIPPSRFQDQLNIDWGPCLFRCSDIPIFLPFLFSLCIKLIKSKKHLKVPILLKSENLIAIYTTIPPAKRFLLLLQKLKLTPHSPPAKFSSVQMYCKGVGYIWLFREILHLELTTEGSGVRFSWYLEIQNKVMFSETF